MADIANVGVGDGGLFIKALYRVGIEMLTSLIFGK